VTDLDLATGIDEMCKEVAVVEELFHTTMLIVNHVRFIQKPNVFQFVQCAKNDPQ
jgi:hypothetical protein